MKADYILVAVVLLLVAGTQSWAEEAQWTPELVKKLTATHIASAPAGWTLQGAPRYNVTPEGWFTNQPGVAAAYDLKKDDAESVTVYVLPRLWIGIRRDVAIYNDWFFRPQVYADHKLIIVYVNARHDPMSWRGEISPDPQTAKVVFAGHLEEADAESQALLAKHCQNARERENAVFSLIKLGVPAAKLITETALHGNQREVAIMAFADTGGPLVIEALKKLCEKPDPRNWHIVVYQIRQLDEPSLLPVTVDALKCTDPASHEAHELASQLIAQHCESAGDSVLAVFRAQTDIEARMSLAVGLGTLHTAAAAKELETFKRAVAPNGTSVRDDLAAIGRQERIAKALQQCTGKWGEPAAGFRLSLKAPTQATEKKSTVIEFYAENLTEEVQLFNDWKVTHSLLLDGKPAPTANAPQPIDSYSNPTWRANEVECTACDVGALLSPGEHTLQFKSGEAKSNVVLIHVEPRKSR